MAGYMKVNIIALILVTILVTKTMFDSEEYILQMQSVCYKKIIA